MRTLKIKPVTSVGGCHVVYEVSLFNLKMFEAQEINAEHKDLIHDVAYDFYGQRMATCSSDQYVKVSYKLIITFNLHWQNLVMVLYYLVA